MIFTELDPNAAIRGSRDPLGLQPVWTRFGRKVVGNLTTVTTSVRSFTTLLLGLHAVELALEGGASESDAIDLFIAFEQLVGYSREAHAAKFGDADDVRGIRRVRHRLFENRSRITISPKPRHQILSNQRTYGVRGMFVNAASATGWVENGDVPRLTAAGRDLVEKTYDRLLTGAAGRCWRSILGFMKAERTFEPLARDKKLAMALAESCRATLRPVERPAYLKNLVRCDWEGDPSKGNQSEMWRLIEQLNGVSGGFGWEAPFSMEELRAAMKLARSAPGKLSDCLEEIAIVEPVLVACDHAYIHAAACDGQTRDSALEMLRRAWGSGLSHLQVPAYRSLRPMLEDAGGSAEPSIRKERAEELIFMAEALKAGDYAAFLDRAILRNTALMRGRGGAPWLTVERGKLKAGLKVEYGGLPAKKGLPLHWQNTYFLNSLKVVGAVVTGRA